MRGVARAIVEQMAGMIMALKEKGVSILLSRQNPRFAGLVGDRADLVEKRQIRFEGSMKVLAANERARKA